MNGMVLNDAIVSQLFSQIEKVIETTRDEMSALNLKYDGFDTHKTLLSSKDLLKTYGNVADDYAKVCFTMQGVAEAIMDVKSVKRTISSESTNVVPAMIKSYKYKADTLIEKLTDLKEACSYAKAGMEVRVRYLSSVSYTSYDKAMGARC